MEITKTVKHHVNMGNYENVEFSASVTMTVDENDKEALDKINELLANALANDVKSAEELTNEKDTYVSDWFGEKEE